MLAYSLCSQLAPRCLNFWNKWSWCLCVIPTWRVTYNVNKWTHMSYLVVLLVTIIKTKTRVCRFLLAYSLYPQTSTRYPDFWSKWSIGLCLIPTWRMTYNVNKLTRKTFMALFLVTIIKTKNTNLSIIACLQLMHPSCTKMPRLLN